MTFQSGVPALVRTEPFLDSRGTFRRVFCHEALSGQGLDFKVAQVNISTTASQGTIRGLHFQVPPFSEGKIIRCLRGAIFDVAVDVRAGSPTLLRAFSFVLDFKEDNQVFIPQGFAHGFQTLTDDVHLLYLHSRPWMPEFERRLCPTDPGLGINWPREVTEISERDRSAPPVVPESFIGVTL